MDMLHLKTIIKNSIIHYGISMAVAGSLYGEKRQSCTVEEKKSSEKGEQYHSLIAEKAYNNILFLLDDLLMTPCKDDTHGENITENSLNDRSIRE
jgi:hypothetical protein